MAEACRLVSARNINPGPSHYPAAKAKSLKSPSQFSITRAASKRNDFSLNMPSLPRSIAWFLSRSCRRWNRVPSFQSPYWFNQRHAAHQHVNKNTSRGRRRLIKISTSDGRWQGKWNCDYLLSLRDLRLQDLVEDDEHKDAQVFINLCIQKHAGFGLSVDGRILTSFGRKCSICSSPYCREVIYVKPGNEADLDSLVQDSIRLTTSVKDACSELCERSEPILHCIEGQNVGSTDMRWSRLLELRNSHPNLKK